MTWFHPLVMIFVTQSFFVRWSRNRAKGTISQKKNQGDVDNASLPPGFIDLGFVNLSVFVLKKNFV